MFLDESGVHWDDPSQDYPVFVLGGVIMSVDYAKTTVERELAALKTRHFGDPGVVLHTSEIIRNQGAFVVLKDSAKRDAFFTDLNALMRGFDYKVVACAIRKPDYASRYGAAALDPYACCLGVLVERFCYETARGAKPGWVVAECRRPDLDQQLMNVWGDLKKKGTGFVEATEIRAKVQELLYRWKSENIAGLQLADLVVSPIGRHVMGKPDREDWSIVESKFRRGNGGGYMGYGLVVLP